MSFCSKSENQIRAIRLLTWSLILVSTVLFQGCISDGSSEADNVDGSSCSSVLSSSSVECANTYGTNAVIDCRDGQVYKTVVIGTQTWMAENLNYAVDSSWCYENSADNCAKYGRLYQWDAAMKFDSTYTRIQFLSDSLTTHQGICLVGWHMPNDDEWQKLYAYVADNNGGDRVGTSLKSTTGWTTHNGIVMTDQFSFSALPAGLFYGDSFSAIGISAYFWSTSQTCGDLADYWTLSNSDEYFYGLDDGFYKYFGLSVRCVKDFE